MRYPFSEQQETSYALAKTEWIDLPEQRYHVIGQRVFYTLDAEYSILQVSKLVFYNGR